MTEIKKSNCCPTVGASYLQNYYLERQHEKYRCCLHWKTVFLAKTIMGDGNSLQICSPPSLLLISAYTVNKKHDSRLIRATCYLLTRWHNLVRMLFKLKLFKKQKARHFMKSLIKYAKRKSIARCYLKTAFCESQQKKNYYQCCLTCRTFPRK